MAYPPKMSSSTEKDSMDNSSMKSPQPVKFDVSAATFLDIAVLRCLFISHWHEDGVYWCLHYMYNRLEIYEPLLYFFIIL